MPGPQVCFGPYSLDAADGCVWHGTKRLPLAPKCFALLHYLVTHSGRLVTKEDLLEAVWPGTHVADGVLKVRMREIRAALGDEATRPHFIETVHRRGYRFLAEVRTEATQPAATKRPNTWRGTAHHAPVGRDAELGQLRQRFEAALHGERQIVFVTGEAGIGKTALVDAFAASLAPAATLVGRGQCLAHYGGGEAYLPVLDALGQLVRGPRSAAIVAVLRRLAPTWLTQLPWLLEPADRELLQRELLGTTRERMLREMAEALEFLAATEPLVVILEDLHWSDPSTLDLLNLLAHRRQAAQLFVVATYRPVEVILSGHGLKHLKQRLEQQRLCGEIRVPFLSREHIASYLQLRLQANEVPTGLADTVFRRTGGNPLFVVSLVDHMIDRQWLVPSAGSVALNVSLATIGAEVAEGVRQMIEQQLERLSDQEALVLEAASIAGDEFAAATIAAALDTQAAQVEAVCEAEVRRGQLLRSLGVIALPDGSVCGRYSFAHSLHRDVLDRRLGAARRVELHRRIGEWCEGMGAGPAELARHFLEATAVGCGDKAVSYSKQAAERARVLLAYAEAAQHYERALGVLPQAGARQVERCELLIALGQAQERSGALSRSIETFTLAADLARTEGADALFAEATLGIGRGHHLVGRVNEQLITLLDEALTRLDPDDSPLRACLLARLDTALSPIPGAHVRREPLRHEALAMARRLGDAETLLRVLQYTRWGFSGGESTDELRTAATELQALAARVPGKEEALHFQLLHIAHLEELGEVDAAGAALEMFSRMAEAAAIPWFSWFALRLSALRALQEGHFNDAERIAEEAMAYGHRMDHPNVRPVFGAQILSLRFLQGRFAEMAPRLTRFVAHHSDQHTSRAQLAYLYLQEGDSAAARHEFDELAIDDFSRIARDSVWLICLAYLAEVCAGLDDRPRAATLREMLSPYAHRVIGVGPSIASMGHGSRYVALLATVEERWDEAAVACATALRAHERMGARPWLAYSWRDQAHLLLRQPCTGRARTAAQRQAADCLRRALGLARELGMNGLQREVLRIGMKGVD